MHWTQLQPGTLVAERRYVDLGPIVIHRRRHQTAFKGDGQVRTGHTLFGFTSGKSSVTRWNGLDVTGEDLAMTRGSIDVFSSAPETLYAVVISDDVYRECGAPASICAALQRVPSDPALIRSAHTRHLRSYVAGLLDNVVRGFSKPSLCANVLWLLAAAVADEAESLKPTRPQSRRIAAVRCCVEFIEQHLGEAVSLPSLSAVSGLRPRSLINAFEAVTGSSPMAYLRARRLCGVRTVLESASCERVRIIDVAADWGFWHMGHFTSAYRAMFGETPSQTLSRASNPIRARTG